MRLSAIVCSYNHAAYVGEAIGSILSQSRPPDEILVVDDGSEDRTAEIVRSFGSDVRLIEQANAGIVSARNRGIAETSGDLVALIDSDDRIEPDRFERQVEGFRRRPDLGLSYGDCWIIDAEGRRLGRFAQRYPPREAGDPAAELFSNYCFIPAITVMFRREVFAATGPLWGPGPSTDYLKWIEIALVSAIERIPGPPLGSWRRHPSATSAGDRHRQERLYMELRDALGALWERSAPLQQRVPPARLRRRMASCHFMAAIHAAREGDDALSARHFHAAVRLCPADPQFRTGWIASLPWLRWVGMPLIRTAADRRLGGWS